MSSSSSVPLSAPQVGDLRILLRCVRYLRPYWKLATGAYATLVIINGLNLLIPQIIKAVIDKGIGGHNIRYLVGAVLGLLGITAVRGLFTYFQGLWSEIMSQNVAADLRNELHSKLAALSFAYHDRTETGQLLSRAVQDVDRIRFLTGRAILRLVD